MRVTGQPNYHGPNFQELVTHPSSYRRWQKLPFLVLCIDRASLWYTAGNDFVRSTKTTTVTVIQFEI
jgi:hypothetical protein